MYITCEQCSTIFRLDENLLKPTGSKVRCSQCRNVFVAKPPNTFEDHADDADMTGDSPDQYQDTLDQELEGIDVAELDSILEEGRSAEMVTDLVDQEGVDTTELLADFDEADLDMDFESALEHEDEAPAMAQSIADPEVEDIPETVEEVGEKLDFDMDFELDDWDEELIEPAEATQDDDLDLAMDFDLEGGDEDVSDEAPPESEDLGDDDDMMEEAMLDENVELALDDFEDVLGGADSTDQDDLPSVDISDEELELDLDSDEAALDEPALDEPTLDEMDTQDLGAVGLGDLDNLMDDDTAETAGEGPQAVAESDEADDLDLSGLDAFLDEDDDASDAENLSEDVDLSLDGDVELASEAALGESGLAFTAEGEDDGFDLADLDEVLEEDDGQAVAAQSDDEAFSMGDELELSLDEDIDVDTPVDDSDITLAGDQGADQDDDLDLADIGDLLDDDDAPAAASSDDDELSLSDDMELSLDDELSVGDTPADAVSALAGTDSGDDDLDLADLDDLLDGDDDPSAEASADDEALSLEDDLELSLDEDLAEEATADVGDTLATVDAEDEDLDLADLEGLLDGDDEASTDASVDDDALSLDDDLELSLDEDLTVEGAGDGLDETLAAVDAEDEDLDLADLDGFLDEDDEATVALAKDDEALSLDDDALELSMDVESDPEVDEKTQLIDASNDRDEFDLSDFENLLGDDAAVDTTESATDLFADDDDADISGQENLLDEEAVLPDADATEDLDLSMEDDLELSFDDEPSTDNDDGDAPALSLASDDDDDDLDLSGLEETLLVDDDTEAVDDAGEELDLSLEDDMELSLDEDLDDDLSDSESADDLGELEDLEFELDAEFEDKPIAQTAESADDELSLDDDQQDEAMDLSDIEKMLEEDTIVPDKADASGDASLDLEAGGAEKWANETSDDLLGLDDDEIDLSEIEEAIDAVDGDDTDDIFADADQEQELELDLDLEEEEETAESDDSSEEFELELEMESDDEAPTVLQESLDDDDGSVDLSDFDLSVEDEEEQPTVETETIDGGDIQLEFQIEEGGADTQDAETISASASASAATSAAASATTGFLDDEDAFSGEETIAAEPVPEKPEVGMAPPPKKKSGKKSLIAIPILLLLAVAGYFGYDFTVKNDIRIPLVSDYLNPKPKDPSGILKLATMEINSKFIENETAGRLFVITGKVRNGYDLPRKLIRLKGKLYTKGKVLVKTEITFAGLVMADQELSSSSMTDIKKRLNTTTGQDLAITVEAGKSSPFMVVFDQLPADLDEFVIETVSSIKAE